ncbi:ABC transporter substrate-binding protein [Psychromicrobium lacuslunae]|uniref:Fe/B12 periplasmic-binding domain-containing protein n=1 Tax=Psychromicrobium lacuslunae TaxID=1618207 RepID=A0A0D4BW32_9MICC|nr:iron-siderophore ABC transporter substrate-binding protein [Psychromicrobium lacuslunae]AJT40662.1 hypothetical protein UM93_02380 [Psychromicrobium lacuslunae]
MDISTVKKLRVIGALLIGAVALSACGTTQPAATAPGSTAVESITVKDDLGRSVKLDKPAERVVTTEWQQTEDVLTLGVTPVGVADIAGYKVWDTAESLPDSVKDVGTRQEPNLDAIFSLNPDLVIVEASSETPLVKQLSAKGIAVLVSKGADGKDSIAKMKQTFQLVAEALGKQDKAKEAINSFDAKLAEGKKKIEEAAPSSKDFLYLDAYLEGSNISIRIFGKGSFIGDLGSQLGLKNLWTGNTDPVYGFAATDVEGLSALKPSRILYTAEESKDWLTPLENNALWKNIPAVKDGKVKAFPSGIWTFGGPKSGEQVIDAFVAAVTS